MKILFTVFDNFEDIELITPLDILRRAGVSYDICSFNNKSFVKKDDLIINTTIDNPNLNLYDGIIIHGGAAVKEMRKSPEFIEVVKHFKKEDKWIFAICDAPNFLYEKGIISKEKYTSYPIQNIESGVNRIEKKSLVQDKKLITANGPGAAHQFALLIIKNLKGEQVYLQIKNGMLF